MGSCQIITAKCTKLVWENLYCCTQTAGGLKSSSSGPDVFFLTFFSWLFASNNLTKDFVGCAKAFIAT